jgi:hypothetical protein
MQTEKLTLLFDEQPLHLRSGLVRGLTNSDFDSIVRSHELFHTVEPIFNQEAAWFYSEGEYQKVKSSFRGSGKTIVCTRLAMRDFERLGLNVHPTAFSSFKADSFEGYFMEPEVFVKYRLDAGRASHILMDSVLKNDWDDEDIIVQSLLPQGALALRWVDQTPDALFNQAARFMLTGKNLYPMERTDAALLQFAQIQGWGERTLKEHPFVLQLARKRAQQGQEAV